MIKNIKGIKYHNEPNMGEAFGGGIYNATCNIGFSNQPTKISLSVVSEDSSYTITKDDLNVTDTGAKTITIGGTTQPDGSVANAVTFRRMYLYSWSKNDSPGAKTLTVNFVDHSIMLDKIFVGLIGRHGTRTTVDTGESDLYNPANDAQCTPIAQTFAFRLSCLECNEIRPSKMLNPPSWEAPHEITRWSYMAGDGQACPQPLRTYINVLPGQESVNGGYILLGQEAFKETECEIPKVTYTFDDLCNALDWILGGDPQNCNGAGAVYMHNLRDFNRSATYEAAYTGTLREVLNAWASDFAFDFTFDYSTPNLWIRGIDLKEPINLRDVKDAVSKGFGPDSVGGLIRSHTEVHTLENTYYQTPIVKYIKPPRPFQRQKIDYVSRIGQVLGPRDALGNSAHLGRSDDDLYVSMALAKYSQEARLIWLSDLARSKSENPYWCNPNHTTMADDVHGHGLTVRGGCYQGPGAVKDPFFDSTVHGDCSNSNYVTEFDCTMQGYSWSANADDLRLRRDSPWMSLGFYPAISFNGEMNKSIWPSRLQMDMDAATGKPKPMTAVEVAQFDPKFLEGGNCEGTPKKRYPVAHKTPCRTIKKMYINSDGTLKDLTSLAGDAGTTETCAGQTVGGMAAQTCYQYHYANAKARENFDARFNMQQKYSLCEKQAHPIWCNPENFSVYLGIWNEAYQDKVGEFDKELADNFLGKYGYWHGNRTTPQEVEMGIFNYGPINPPPNERQCPKFTYDLDGQQQHAIYMYQFKVSTLPESKIYSGHSYPFNNILRANGGFFAMPPGTIDTWPHCTYCPSRSIFEITDNAWGTEPDQVNEMLRNKYVIDNSDAPDFVRKPSVLSDLNIYVPRYKRLDVKEDEGYFISIVGMANWHRSILNKEHMKSGYFPGIAFIPHLDKMKIDVTNDLCYEDRDGDGIVEAGDNPKPVYTNEKDCISHGLPAEAATATSPAKPARPYVWVQGAVVRQDSVLEVKYDHWRCTQNQINGVAPCPPANQGICVGADCDGNGAPDLHQPIDQAACVTCGGTWTGFNCADHWCATGNGTCAGAKDDAGVVKPEQPILQEHCVADGGTWNPGSFSHAALYSMPPYSQAQPDGAPNIDKWPSCTDDPDDVSYNPYCWGQYREDAEVFGALVYQNWARRMNESLIGQPSDCVLYCEEDIKSEVCACPEIDKPVHGFASYASRYLEVTHLDSTVKIVYPIEQQYTGFWLSEQFEKGSSQKKQNVMGEPPKPQQLKEMNVMGTRIIDVDATPDLDTLEASEVGKFQEQLVVNNNFFTPPQPEVVTLPEYYVFLLGTEQSADAPGEQIDVKLDGTEFDTLAPLLTPANGLNTFNISLDGDGVSTSLSFRSRPKKLPKREVLMQKIGPQAIEGRIPKPMKDMQDYRDGPTS